MASVQEGEDPEDAAAAWVEENAEKVAEWTDDVKNVDGDEIHLGYVAWDSEIASTNVLGQVLNRP